MTSVLTLPLEEQRYPSGDGQPMAENTEQYRWLVLIKENLEMIFATEDQVFIAGDLLWYPVPAEVQNPPPRYAPDVMVVFGRPKGKRKSYRQWLEGQVAPQVVFEILSDSNRSRQGRQEMAQKLAFYDRYGVEEYYIYDPDGLILEIWQAQGNQGLRQITDPTDWLSPRLGVRFRWQPGQELQLFTPEGQPFLSSIELQTLMNQERERGDRAEAQLRQVAQNLLSTGMTLTQVAQVMALSPEQVQTLMD
jgi:Uma2 family endonuclease